MHPHPGLLSGARLPRLQSFRLCARFPPHGCCFYYRLTIYDIRHGRQCRLRSDPRLHLSTTLLLTPAQLANTASYRSPRFRATRHAWILSSACPRLHPIFPCCWPKLVCSVAAQRVNRSAATNRMEDSDHPVSTSSRS